MKRSMVAELIGLVWARMMTQRSIVCHRSKYKCFRNPYLILLKAEALSLKDGPLLIELGLFLTVTGFFFNEAGLLLKLFFKEDFLNDDFLFTLRSGESLILFLWMERFI